MHAFQCGPRTLYTQDRGVIKSHVGYDAGHQYGKNLDCVWTIEAPPGKFVQITAEDFNLESRLEMSFEHVICYIKKSSNLKPDMERFRQVNMWVYSLLSRVIPFRSYSVWKKSFKWLCVWKSNTICLLIRSIEWNILLETWYNISCIPDKKILDLTVG